MAILGHRAVLEGGGTFDIPDFRNPEDVLKYENDRLSPFYGSDGSEPTLPCCSHPDHKPTEKQVELYLKIWQAIIISYITENTDSFESVFFISQIIKLYQQ